MSAQNVEIVKAIHDALNDGDPEAALEHIDRETVFLGSGDISAGEEGWRGREGVRDGMAEYLKAWDDYRLEVHDVIDCGDRVLVEAREHGRGRGSGVEISDWLYLLWTIRDDKATRLKTYRERDEARDAAGLPPASG
jgi:ketosteroid isomerase-like protein